jgi:hypothetical protein
MATTTKPAPKQTAKSDVRREPQPATNRPVHEVRVGRIRAAIWANPTEAGVRHNVTVARLYKDDKSGEWRDSQSFGREDLPLVAKVCDLAMMWIYEQGNGNGHSSDR